MSLSFTDKTFPPTELEKLTGAGSVCSLMFDPASPNTAGANSTEPYSPHSYRLLSLPHWCTRQALRRLNFTAVILLSSPCCCSQLYRASKSRCDLPKVYSYTAFSPVTQLNQFAVMLETCWRECLRRIDRRKKVVSTDLAPPHRLQQLRSLFTSAQLSVSVAVLSQLNSAQMLSSHS